MADDVWVWVGGECVGLIDDTGQPTLNWPDISGRVIHCRRLNYRGPMPSGEWREVVIYADARSKELIAAGLAEFRAVYGFADG